MIQTTDAAAREKGPASGLKAAGTAANRRIPYIALNMPNHARGHPASRPRTKAMPQAAIPRNRKMVPRIMRAICWWVISTSSTRRSKPVPSGRKRQKGGAIKDCKHTRIYAKKRRCYWFWSGNNRAAGRLFLLDNSKNLHKPG